MTETEIPLPPSAETPRLCRFIDDKMIAGVASGLSRHFEVDVTLVRLGFAVLAIFGGSGLLLYLLAWLIMPTEPLSPENDAPAACAQGPEAR